MKYLAYFFALTILGLSLPAIAQQDTIQSNRYLTNQESVNAKIIRVSERDRTITVRGERGQVRKFVVPEGTRLSVNGRDARLRDMRRGDSIQLVMRAQANDVVVAQIRVPQTAVTLEERRATPVVEEYTPAMLPKTASMWPTVLVIGTFALLGALTIRRRRLLK